VNLHDAARKYLAAGLAVLPARRDQKRPTVSWKPFQKRLPTENEVDAWFANNPPGLCLLTGTVSGNHEVIDFDQRGALFEAWYGKVHTAAPGLLERLVISKTQNDGRHVSYRHQADSCGNLKLAQRAADSKVVTLIETRGEGGLYLCAPTPGYEVVQGDLCGLPVLSEAERDVLLQCAWELNEHLPTVVDGPRTAADNADIGPCATHIADNRPCAADIPHIGGSLADKADRPGDDFNNRGDVRAVLAQRGWRCVRGGENEYWCRPGKTSGTSATLKDRVFYVFSSNAAPFEPNRAYSPFAVYTLLEHGGNYEQAARSLRLSGYGSDCAADSDAGVDLSAIVGRTEALSADTAAQPPENPTPTDPGPFPDELLRVPGFVGEVMDFCLETAPYPNPVMAFCGAIGLQAFLAGRKVRDPGDNRTNIYLLGLAHSSAGKDHPRKVNTRIAHEVGLAECMGDRFASGEGIQDALFLTPSMLFQTDEIDGMLQSINKAKDARHENIMGTLLTMYSASNSVFPMRRKAGKEAPGVIDQPCLVVFGTAIPNHYYEALSQRMLTNGFFARMIILEAGRRCSGQEPRIRDLPPRVIETAQWWAQYQPGECRGNLLDVHPVPAIIEHTDEARQLLVETRQEAEAEYSRAEASSDVVGTTVWGRVSEQIRKLALLYAISENRLSPSIGQAAVAWASRFVMHQTRRMLFMAAMHVADNPFHAECLKLTQKLRDAPGQQLSHQVLLKRMKMRAKDFKDLMDTLVLGGDVVVQTLETKGRTGMVYRLSQRGKEGVEGEASPQQNDC
jgi:hypothetical protein